ncbi:competence protein [Streptococcus mitis]|uniref:Competence protein n=1 Tax=Streptococcus mitis TaxID=28037 RepID=A0A1X1JI31_STRMT|nr:competence protein [Streptococcus mitis]
MLEKCKDHLILIDGVEFSLPPNKKPQHEQGI